MVMVDGRIVVEDHKLLTDDESRVVREANAAAKRIAQELAQVPGPRICRWQNGQRKGILDPSRVGSKRQDINHGC